jgi:putative ABC transport system substrate-binding protein
MIRSFVAVALALGVLAAPFPAASQPQGARRVGFVSAGARTPDGLPPAALRDALRSLGYAEQSLTYDARFAEGKVDRLPGFMAELVQRNVEVIVTQGGPTALAAKRATATIPIVLALGAGDAVATGLIASLARPGGNITGISEEAVQLSAKRLEILKEAVPKAARIAIMWNADDLAMSLRYREIEKAARILNVEVQPLGVREPNDFEHAFAAMTRARPDAMFLVADSLTILNRRQVIEFAAARRIPAMYELGFIVRDGGLMAYGPAADDQFRTAATYVDRILKGAKPPELPVEQPSRYYFAVNLKTAASLGLTIPPPLLLRADQVIQ